MHEEKLVLKIFYHGRTRVSSGAWLVTGKETKKERTDLSASVRSFYKIENDLVSWYRKPRPVRQERI